MGHCRNCVPTCVIARYMRMKGYNVLHPMGWDAFGLPAENYAIKMKVHPAVITKRNTDNYRPQMQLIDASYDWEREVNSSAPDCYHWTQWFFQLLFKRDVDITLIRENLKLTVEQRLRNLQNLQRFAEERGEAGKRLRQTSTKKLSEDGQ